MASSGNTAGRIWRCSTESHIGFVAAGGPPAYYSDALSQFSDALQLAAEVGARDLFRVSGLWLAWLAWMAGLTPGSDATTIRIATDVPSTLTLLELVFLWCAVALVCVQVYITVRARRVERERGLHRSNRRLTAAVVVCAVVVPLRASVVI